MGNLGIFMFYQMVILFLSAVLVIWIICLALSKKFRRVIFRRTGTIGGLISKVFFYGLLFVLLAAWFFPKIQNYQHYNYVYNYVQSEGKTAEELIAEGDRLYKKNKGQEAADRYKAAAAKGSCEAACRLGFYNLYGEWSGGPSTAFYWYRKAARKGCANGATGLADLYSGWTGWISDPEKAVKLCREAAELGEHQAQAMLAIYYAEGKLVEKNEEKAEYWFKKAESWYKKAIEVHNPEAQYFLGLCYLHGWCGLEKNEAEGVKLIYKAAMQRHPRAAYILAQCYRDGKGVAKNLKQYAKWLKIAADKRVVAAEWELGNCYEYGLHGFPKSERDAELEYYGAAVRGNKEAQKKMEARGRHVEKIDGLKDLPWF